MEENTKPGAKGSAPPKVAKTASSVAQAQNVQSGQNGAASAMNIPAQQQQVGGGARNQGNLQPPGHLPNAVPPPPLPPQHHLPQQQYSPQQQMQQWQQLGQYIQNMQQYHWESYLVWTNQMGQHQNAQPQTQPQYTQTQQQGGTTAAQNMPAPKPPVPAPQPPVTAPHTPAPAPHPPVLTWQPPLTAPRPLAAAPRPSATAPRSSPATATATATAPRPATPTSAPAHDLIDTLLRKKPLVGAPGTRPPFAGTRNGYKDVLEQYSRRLAKAPETLDVNDLTMIVQPVEESGETKATIKEFNDVVRGMSGSLPGKSTMARFIIWAIHRYINVVGQRAIFLTFVAGCLRNLHKLLADHADEIGARYDAAVKQAHAPAGTGRNGDGEDDMDEDSEDRMEVDGA